MPHNRNRETPAYVTLLTEQLLAEGEAFNMNEELLFDDRHIIYSVRRMQELGHFQFETQRDRRLAQRAIWPFIEGTGVSQESM